MLWKHKKNYFAVWCIKQTFLFYSVIQVTNLLKWRSVYAKLNLPPSNTASHQIKNSYKKYLHAFEDFYRKLGSSMGTISRPGRSRSNSGRTIHVPFKKGAKVVEKKEDTKVQWNPLTMNSDTLKYRSADFLYSPSIFFGNIELGYFEIPFYWKVFYSVITVYVKSISAIMESHLVTVSARLNCQVG